MTFIDATDSEVLFFFDLATKNFQRTERDGKKKHPTVGSSIREYPLVSLRLVEYIHPDEWLMARCIAL